MTPEEFTARNEQLESERQAFERARSIHRAMESAQGIVTALMAQTFTELKVELRTKEGRVLQLYEINAKLFSDTSAPKSALHGDIGRGVQVYLAALEKEFSEL